MYSPKVINRQIKIQFKKLINKNFKNQKPNNRILKTKILKKDRKLNKMKKIKKLKMKYN